MQLADKRGRKGWKESTVRDQFQRKAPVKIAHSEMESSREGLLPFVIQGQQHC